MNLEMTPHDQQSILRVIGFMEGKQKVGIQEFISILEERPKMRELWETQLFQKLLNQIQQKGIDNGRFFDLMDVNSDCSLSTIEFKNGLTALKIILNNKDLNNLFVIFDKDSNGSISLEEMKGTLDYYAKLLKDKEVAFEQKSGLDDFESQEGKIEADSGETPIMQRMNDDLTELVGELKL